jgi:hypothetical protein
VQGSGLEAAIAATRQLLSIFWRNVPAKGRPHDPNYPKRLRYRLHGGRLPRARERTLKTAVPRPLAAKLVGEHDKKILAAVLRHFVGAWSVVIRVVIIDDYIRRAIAAGGDTSSISEPGSIRGPTSQRARLACFRDSLHLGGSETTQPFHSPAVLHAGLVRPQEPVRVAGAPRGVETICRLRASGPEVIGASGRLEQDDVIGHLWRMRRETDAA